VPRKKPQTPISAKLKKSPPRKPKNTEAGFSFPIHPHMLRHSTGFYLANLGHDTRAIQGYLGHANIKNTVIYTELSPERFKEFWRD